MSGATTLALMSTAYRVRCREVDAINGAPATHHSEVDYLEESGGEGCVLLLDFQQAYDRVDRDWVFAVMRALGFGERALRWVRLLLRDTCARVLFNGWSSNQFVVRSGVAQGSPLSPVMYVIAAQPR